MSICSNNSVYLWSHSVGIPSNNADRNPSMTIQDFQPYGNREVFQEIEMRREREHCRHGDRLHKNMELEYHKWGMERMSVFL